MRKFILLVGSVLIFLTSSFNSNTHAEVSVPDSFKLTKEFFYGVGDTQSETKEITPQLSSGYIAFREALGFKESQGDYSRVNSFGYMGKYQFGKSTLEFLGVKDHECFLNNPAFQERIFDHYTSRNKWVLRKYISFYAGKTIHGVEITESGILAAAHLAGPGNVKKFLVSWGEEDFEDGYGTSVSNYMKKFAGYDVSVVQMRKDPKFI